MSSIYRLPLLTVLVSLVGILSLTLADLLPWPVFVVLASLHVYVCLRFSQDFPLHRSSEVLITLLVFSLEGVRFFFEGQEAFIPMLRDIIVYFAVLRLVLPKREREIYQIVGISLTQCIFSTIFTQSPLFLIGLMLMALLVPMILSRLDGAVFGQAGGSEPESIHWLKVWTGIVIIACALFFIIPRPTSTLLRYGLAQQAKTGYSEEINLSQDKSLLEDSGVVMRIVWEQGIPPKLFYLSGSRLDGLTHEGFVKGPQHTTLFVRGGKASRNSSGTDRILIYPSGLDALNVFYPFQISDIYPQTCIWKGPNLYWSFSTPPVYEVLVSREEDRSIEGYTWVPEGLEDIAALARSIAGEAPKDLKPHVLASYVGSSCRYTLDRLDIPEGVSPMYWFVFEGRKGSCEHFASALAVMIRGCGIPSRVVTGFLVHELNTAGGYYIVRAKDAHAWVEYFDGNAWKTIDATPLSGALAKESPSLLDALKFRWIRWVIQYSLDDQMRLAVSLFSPSRGIEREVGYTLTLMLVSVIPVLIIGVVYVRMRQGKTGPYRAVLRALKKKGLELDSNSVHEEHLAIIACEWPELEESFRIFLRDYLSWRFGYTGIDIRARTSEMVGTIEKTPLGRDATG